MQMFYEMVFLVNLADRFEMLPFCIGFEFFPKAFSPALGQSSCHAGDDTEKLCSLQKFLNSWYRLYFHVLLKSSFTTL